MLLPIDSKRVNKAIGNTQISRVTMVAIEKSSISFHSTRLKLLLLLLIIVSLVGTLFGLPPTGNNARDVRGMNTDKTQPVDSTSQQ
jgi:hypothetical protein